MSYTYVVMPVPQEVFGPVLKNMREAGYEHALVDEVTIDMRGIALQLDPEPLTTGTLVKLDYTNYRAERRLRKVRPLYLWFGQTEYHPEQQFLLRAYDVEKKVYRDFAMRDIHGWFPVEP